MNIIINEVHPNPENGSEWIELIITDFSTNQEYELNGLSLSDATKQIYQFPDEFIANQEYLVAEVTGLNNDQDSVILKDASGINIDSFSYTSTQKGLSWSRISEQQFVLNQPSKGLQNPSPTPSPSPSLDPSSIPILPTPSLTTTISLTPTQNQPINSSPPQPNKQQSHQVTKKPDWVKTYPIQQMQLRATNKHVAEFASRLVILGDRQGQRDLQNAIMGSLLLLVSGALLLYGKIKSTKKHL